MLTDQQFTAQFESLTLDPVYFDHQGHIRITWIYLKKLPFEQVFDKVASGINQYACSLGANDKYHQTMTYAFVQIITHRFRKNPCSSWSEFLKTNPDLVQDANKLIGQHYSKELINSDEARTKIIEPDINDFVLC